MDVAASVRVHDHLTASRSRSSSSSSFSSIVSIESTVSKWRCRLFSKTPLEQGELHTASVPRTEFVDYGRRAAAIGSDRMEVQARKFYSQRNMYLTGFTLFLSLILNRTYGMILDVLRLEEKVKLYEGDEQAGGKEGEKLSKHYRADQIGELKKQLDKKDKELAAIKSQAEGLQREYDELSVKYNQQNPSTGDKKSN